MGDGHALSVPGAPHETHPFPSQERRHGRGLEGREDDAAMEESYKNRLSDLRPMLMRLQRTAADAQKEILHMRQSTSSIATTTTTTAAAVVSTSAPAAAAMPVPDDREMNTGIQQRTLRNLNKAIHLYKMQSRKANVSDARRKQDEQEEKEEHVTDMERASELVLLLFEQQQKQIAILKSALAKVEAR